MIEFITQNKEFLAILASLFGVVIPLATFLITKNKEQRQINFEKFHRELIKDLSNQEGKLGLDQQVAVIYELRNYPEYYPVIDRLLYAGIKRWKTEIKQKSHFNQLITEANETMGFISSNFFIRFCINIKIKLFYSLFEK